MISLTKFNFYLLLYIHYSTLHYLLPSMFILYCPFVSIHIQEYISAMSYNSFPGLPPLGGGLIFSGEHCRGKSNNYLNQSLKIFVVRDGHTST